MLLPPFRREELSFVEFPCPRPLIPLRRKYKATMLVSDFYLIELFCICTHSTPFLSDWKARLVRCDLQRIDVKNTGLYCISCSHLPGVLFLSLLADWCREFVPIPASCAEAIDILGDLRRNA